MKSILIVKSSSIGDVIQTLPVLDYLRARFPHARIDWVVEKKCATLLLNHSHLSNLLVIDTPVWRRTLFSKETKNQVKEFVRALRCENYDLLVDFQGNIKSGIVSAFAKAKKKVGFSWESLVEKPNWFAMNKHVFSPPHLSARMKSLHLVKSCFDEDLHIFSTPAPLPISEDEKMRLSGLLKSHPLSKSSRLMVCFGSRWKNKQLDQQTLLQLLKKIDQTFHPSFLFVWGSAEEKVAAEFFKSHFLANSVSVGEMSLNFWQALMANVDAVFAVDSAALHLCATTKTPTFSVFGPSSSHYYKPEGASHFAMQGKCPYGKSFRVRCPILRTCPTGACMRDLKADEIFEQFSTWYQKR